MIKGELTFMRKLLEFSCRPLMIELYGEKFSMAASGDYVEVVYVPSRENEEVSNPVELINFVQKFFKQYLLPVDSDMYTLILKEVMQAAHEQAGMTGMQMVVLIGSLSEKTDPEEAELYLKLVDGIK